MVENYSMLENILMMWQRIFVKYYIYVVGNMSLKDYFKCICSHSHSHANDVILKFHNHYFSFKLEVLYILFYFYLFLVFTSWAKEKYK